MVNDPANLRVVDPVQIWIEHRLMFYSTKMYTSLNWSAKDIETLRISNDVPDDAEIQVNKGRVIFTWRQRFEDGAA